MYILFFSFSFVHIKFSVPSAFTILKCPVAYFRLCTSLRVKCLYHIHSQEKVSCIAIGFKISLHLYYFVTNFGLGILTSVFTLNFQELAVVGSFGRSWKGLSNLVYNFVFREVLMYSSQYRCFIVHNFYTTGNYYFNEQFYLAQF